MERPDINQVRRVAGEPRPSAGEADVRSVDQLHPGLDAVRIRHASWSASLCALVALLLYVFVVAPWEQAGPPSNWFGLVQRIATLFDNVGSLIVCTSLVWVVGVILGLRTSGFFAQTLNQLRCLQAFCIAGHLVAAPMLVAATVACAIVALIIVAIAATCALIIGVLLALE